MIGWFVKVTTNNVQVTTTVTYLELTSRRKPRAASAHRSDISGIWRADPPSVSFYRFLYESVGEPWYWYLRRNMDDHALREIIESPDVEVYVAYVRGTPAGYVELDRRTAGETEIAYLGLFPEFFGRGIGPWLLNWGIERAWREECERVWLHTCTLDHPAALPMYQRAGMQVYQQEEERIDLEDLRRAGFEFANA